MVRKDLVIILLFSCAIITSSIVIVLEGSFYTIESHIVSNKFTGSEGRSSYIHPLSLVSRKDVGRNITLGKYSVFLRFNAPNKDDVHIGLNLGVDAEYYFMAANDSIMDRICSITGSAIPDTPLILTVSIVLNVNNRSTLELPNFIDELIPWCYHNIYASVKGIPGGGVLGTYRETRETIEKGLVDGVNVINVTYVVRARWLTSIDDVARALNVSTDVLRRNVNLTAVVIPSVTMEEYVKYRLVPVTYVFLLAALSVAAIVAGYCVLFRQRKA